MRPIRRLLAHPGRLAWLLWLAMLLPVAQAAALDHGYAHLDPSHADEPAAPHASTCELCLTAAAVTGGAAAVTVPAAPLLRADQAAPAAPAVARLGTAPALAYRSRAPPLPRA